MLKKIFYTVLILCVLSTVGAGSVLYWFVAVEPGKEISEEYIKGILGRESPVFYNDGETPLGVFFADAHRQYVDYEDIPKDFVNALVAAEDNRFFSHFGFDIQGIARAAIKNFQAGKIVQGGSTLTQQTAKNLFKREGRSYAEKLKELLYALRLEYHYSKEQIFEFYANQFYVSGNGHGLGVAARYYFDKEPNELTLVEAAYIAGSVKRPNYYNPFIKRTQEAADEAKKRGKERISYVLNKMHELKMISDSEFRDAMASEIPFKKGAVGFALDYVMEMVTDAVSSDRIVDAMAAHGIDNISTSGVRIITTVDKNIQDRTLYALRKQLSYLDVRLRGYERQEVQDDLEKTTYTGDRELAEGAFLFGVIRSIKRDGDNIGIEVFFGRKLGTGLVDRKGLSHLVDARKKWQENRWSEPAEEDYTKLLEQLQEGDKVWVSVRERNEENVLLDLERFPKVKGGAIVIRNGRIVSVAGGVENRFFNRAVYGRRTMGSSYKPFVYTAALQLGWNAADLLKNRRDVFIYQNQPYFPRPDHHIDQEEVSMSWAGVRSENLASVWLTAHLTDHLTRSQFEEVAGHLGLGPRIVDGEPEPYRLFRSRIRDTYGIVIDLDVLRKAAFRKTLSTIGPDLVFEGLDNEYESLRNLHYGLGFSDFKAEIEADLTDEDSDESSKNELLLRKRILRYNFLALSKLRSTLQAYVAEPEPPWSPQILDNEQSFNQPGLFYNRVTGLYLYDYPSLVPEYAVAVNRTRFQQYLADLSDQGKAEFIKGIRLGGNLSVAAFDFLNRQVEDEFQEMKKLLPYSMDVLEQVEDYRILVGLHYLIALGKALGIESSLEPVLSFPLGSNVVTLLETARVYEALVTGQTSVFPEQNGDINNTLAVIDRIESEDGEILYRPKPERRDGISPQTSLVVGHILENTVKFGTGRYADQNVKLSGSKENDGLDKLELSVPLFGKTGTANRYTNASFFGYLPALNREGNGMVAEGGYGVGVYVGYDDNKAMRRKTTRVTGAVGALPAWTAIVNAIIREKGYTEGLDPVDLSFYGLGIKRDDLGQKNLAVDKEAGGKLIEPPVRVDPLDRYHPSILTFGDLDGTSGFEPARRFDPFWHSEVGQQPASDIILESDLR